jgi:hypothetical protein
MSDQLRLQYLSSTGSYVISMYNTGITIEGDETRLNLMRNLFIDAYKLLGRGYLIMGMHIMKTPRSVDIDPPNDFSILPLLEKAEGIDALRSSKIYADGRKAYPYEYIIDIHGVNKKIIRGLVALINKFANTMDKSTYNAYTIVDSTHTPIRVVKLKKPAVYYHVPSEYERILQRVHARDAVRRKSKSRTRWSKPEVTHRRKRRVEESSPAAAAQLPPDTLQNKDDIEQLEMLMSFLNTEK